MAFCKNCGNIVDDDAKFCTTCGQTITADNQTVYNQNSENYTPYLDNPIPYARPTNESVPPKINAFAITGFVMSICSLVICCLGFLSVPSLIFSIISYVQISKSNQKGKGLAIAGIVISVSTIVIWIVIFILAKLDIIHFYTYQTTNYPYYYDSY